MIEGGSDEAPAPLVRIVGSWTRGAAAHLRRGLAAIEGDVVLDLSELEFLDSAGFGVLFDLERFTTRRGARVFVRGTTPHQRWLLQLVGLGFDEPPRDLPLAPASDLVAPHAA